MEDVYAGRFCWIEGRREVRLSGEEGTLFATPAYGAPRAKLSDLVSAKRAARVKGNRSPEYEDGANTRFWAMVNDTRQKLPTRIGGYSRDNDFRSAPMFTVQSKPLPFESGDNVLPGMDGWWRRMRT